AAVALLRVREVAGDVPLAKVDAEDGVARGLEELGGGPPDARGGSGDDDGARHEVIPSTVVSAPATCGTSLSQRIRGVPALPGNKGPHLRACPVAPCGPRSRRGRWSCRAPGEDLLVGGG